MNSNNRIIVNTLAQYTKTFISGIITLYSARIILSNLGVSDYGIYTLVAGIVAMLSFVTNALSSTTQRFLSLYQGKGMSEDGKVVFCSSICLHFVLGGFLAIILVCISPLLFNGFLNIPSDRISAATVVYLSVALSLFTSFITSPFRATLISHENIVYTSVIDTIDAGLKLGIAFLLEYVSFDKLIAYGVFLWAIQLFNFIAFSFYCMAKYPECIIPKTKYVKKEMLNSLGHFAGWSVFNIGCTIGRTQGLAVVLNKFLSPIANAAYGLGIQVSSYLNYISESLLNAIRPQIVKAEGAGSREKLFRLSEYASKYSFFMLSLFSVPCIIEMPLLLRIWLGDVPDNTVLFCRMMLIAGLVDSITTGLSTANQAIGDLKYFSFFIYLPKLFIIPISVLLLFLYESPIIVAIVYVSVELICSIGRLFLMHIKHGLVLSDFIKNVFMRLCGPLFLLIVADLFICFFINSEYRVFYIFLFPSLMYILAFIYMGITQNERRVLYECFIKIIHK